ncbi:MAG: hypothetical protein AVDCRST_MAG32-107, partial [uncultured Nocardioides sp.]
GREPVRPRAEGGRRGRSAGPGEGRRRRGRRTRLQDQLLRVRRQGSPQLVGLPPRRRQRVHGGDGPVDVPPQGEAPRRRRAVPGVPSRCRAAPARAARGPRARTDLV